MYKAFIIFLRKWLLTDMLTTVNYNQPKQIDGKKNICYYYEISEDTEVEIVDDLKSVESPVIYDIYWQNTDDTSELTFSFDGNTITLGGEAPDLTTQNHIVFIRSPKSTAGTIDSILQSSNRTLGSKRTNIVASTETAPSVSSATVENADPDALVVVFNKAVNITDLTGLSLNFTVGTPKTISSITSGDGTNTLTFALSEAIESTDEFSFVYGATNTIVTSGTDLGLVAGNIAVTNNVEAIANPPEDVAFENVNVNLTATGNDLTSSPSTPDATRGSGATVTKTLPIADGYVEGDISLSADGDRIDITFHSIEVSDQNFAYSRVIITRVDASTYAVSLGENGITIYSNASLPVITSFKVVINSGIMDVYINDVYETSFADTQVAPYVVQMWHRDPNNSITNAIIQSEGGL